MKKLFLKIISCFLVIVIVVLSAPLNSKTSLSLSAKAAPIDAMLDVVLVVDVSGSMSGTDIKNAKIAAKAICEDIFSYSSNVRVGIVSFASSATKYDFSDNKDSCISIINGLSATGSTYVVKALTATETLMASAREWSTKSVVIISDGAFTESDSSVQKAADSLASYCNIVSLGVSVSSSNEGIMTSIATQGYYEYTGGSVSQTLLDALKTGYTSPAFSNEQMEVLHKLGFDINSILSDVNLTGGKMQFPTVSIADKEIDLGTLEASVKLPLGSNLTYTVDLDEKRIKVLIGLEDDQSAVIGPDGQTTKYWSESYQDVKKMYQNVTGKKVDTTKLWNQFSSLRGKMKKIGCSLGFGVEANIAGYVEFDYSTNELNFLEGGIVLAAQASLSLIPDIPDLSVVFVGVGLTPSIGGTLQVAKNVNKMVFLGTIDGKIAANIELGLGWQILGTYVKGGVIGTIGATYSFPAKELSECLYAYLTGELYFDSKVIGFDIWDGKKSLGTKVLYPNVSESSVSSVGNTVLENPQYHLSSASPMAREYSTDLQSSGITFKLENIYHDSAPQLIDLGSGKMMLIWAGDDGSKTDYNRTSIFYTFYDGVAWSTTKKISNNDCYNSTPVITKYNDEVCVVWQRTSIPITEEDNLTDALKNVELYYSIYKDGTFSDEQLLIENPGFAELAHSVVYNSDGLNVLWFENSENNIYGTTGINTLKKVTIDSELQVSTPEVIAESENSFGNYVAFDDGSLKVVYTMTSSGTDSIYCYSNGETKKLTDGSSGITAAHYDGTQIVYSDGPQIKLVNTETSETTVLVDNAGFGSSFFSDGGSAFVVNSQKVGEQYYLYATEYNPSTKKVIESSNIYRSDKYIYDYDITGNSEDGFKIAMNSCTFDLNASDFFYDYTLSVNFGQQYSDVNVNDVAWCHDTIADLSAGESATINFEVQNTGNNDVSSFNYTIVDNSTGVSMDSGTINTVLAAGEIKQYSVAYKIPENFSGCDMRIDVSLNELEENVNDNSAYVSLGLADLEIYDVTSEYVNGEVQVKCKVKNKGFTTSDSSELKVYNRGKSGEFITSISLDSLSYNEVKQLSFVLPSAYWASLDKEELNSIELEVTTSILEENNENNSYVYVYDNLIPFDFVVNDDGVSVGIVGYKGSDANIMIPDSLGGLPVTEIKQSACAGNTKIASVTIPDSVTTFGDGAFANCSKLTTINVSENNSIFSSLDGVLFNKNYTTLVRYPTGRNVTEYNVPDNVTALANQAFAGCPDLISIIVSDSLKNIGSSVFTGCSSFKYIFYTGTQEEWSDISIGSGNTVLKNSYVHYETTCHIYPDEWTVDIAPTCTYEGIKTRHCTQCDMKIDSVVIPAKGHIYSDEWTVDIAPTCTEKGTKSHHCLGCDNGSKSDVTEIPATGHTYSTEWIVDAEPTCTQKGSKSHHCLDCDIKTDITPIDAKGHNYSDEWIVDTAATCTTDGSKSHHCLVCDSKNDITVIEATGHTFSSVWSIDQEPTCIEDGSKSHHCVDCDDKTDVTVIFATGHSFIAKSVETTHPHTTVFICSVCSFEKTETSDCIDCKFIVCLTEAGTYELVSYIGTEKDVVIPESLNDIPITGIDGCFLKDCVDIDIMTIPSSVTDIDIDAFDVDAVRQIHVNENNSKFTSVDGILFSKDLNSVIRCPRKYQGNIILPDGVSAISDKAFYQCTSITGVVFPESVVSIGNQAFSSCLNVLEIDLPDTLEEIGDYAFAYCCFDEISIPENIKKVGIAAFKDNNKLKIVNYNAVSSEVMGDSDSSKYIFSGVDLETINIGKNVDSIPKFTFAGSKAENIVFHEECNLTNIDNYAFYKNNMESIVIRNTVANIGDYAFANCGLLKYVFYEGSQSEWESIKICSNNEPLTDANIHYNSTDHTYTERVEKEPTCYEVGIKYKECTICNYNCTEDIPMVEHNYSDEWITDVEPTCTTKGSKSHHCVNCSDKADITTIPALGHSYGEWVVSKEPTCTRSGSKYQLCAICGDKFTVALPSLGHSYSEEWTIDVEPTCTTTGSKSHHCTVCDVRTDFTTVEATGHDYSEEWTIDVSPTCTEDGSKSHHCVKCEDKINVTVIVAIGHNYVAENMEENHPHNTTYKCSLCEGVKTEPTYFEACFDCNFTISAIDENSYKLVSYIGKSDSAVIPSTYNGLPITRIENNCFKGNTVITSIEIPDTITSMGNAVFYGCTNLEKVIIPGSLESIGNAAFYGCAGLKKVVVSEGVTTIGNSAFRGCTDLETVVIPQSVTQIGDYAFYDCNNIKYVFYEGMESEWGNIDIGNNNSSLTNAIIHYNCEEHTYEYNVDSEPTCSEAGLKSKICVVCGYTEKEDIPILEHVSSDDWIIDYDATCTVDGSKYRKCTVCGDKVEVVTIPATGHSFDNWETQIEPTCTKTGLKNGVCLNCGDLVSESIPALGHNYAAEWTIDIQPTCTEDGSKSHHCTVCGNKTEITVVEATGHSYNDWVVTKEPTCTTSGVKHRICSACDDIIEDTIPAPGHNYSKEWTIDVPPTCTEDGSKSYHCTACDDKTDITVVEATGHNYSSEWTIDKEATCTTAGSKSHHCTACDDKIDVTVIEATGHNYVVQSVETEHPHTTTYKCSLCDDIKTETVFDSGCIACNFTISAIDENSYKLVSYIGTASDVVIPATYNGLPITRIENNCFKGNTSITSVVIPDSITSMGNAVFYGCTNLETVIIPGSLESIGNAAFYGCTGLKDVTISNGVKSIGNSAFRGCSSIETIIIPADVTNIGVSAFNGCSGLKYVFFTGSENDWANVKINSDNASLTDLSVHYNATDHRYEDKIDIKATCTDSGLKHKECSVCGLSLPGEVIQATGHNYTDEWIIDIDVTCTTAGSKSHHCLNCGDKADITVIEATGHSYELDSSMQNHPHANTYKCSFCEDIKTENMFVDVCVECKFKISLIDENSYGLVSYIGSDTDVVIPATYNNVPVTKIEANCFKGNTTIKSVVIPNGVTSMGNAVFYGCTGLEKVTISGSVAGIGNAAFYNCVNLKSVTIADGVNSIGNSAFRGCTGLETIMIPESVTTIGTQAFNGFTGTIYCTKDSAAHNYSILNNINYKLINIFETDNTTIDYTNCIIKTNIQNCADLTELLKVCESSNVVVKASHIYNDVKLLGTGTLVSVYEADTIIEEYTLVVTGDTNGDSVCDVLDCAQVERASNGNTELSGACALAADGNSDNVIDIYDYQLIVNKAVS